METLLAAYQKRSLNQYGRTLTENPVNFNNETWGRNVAKNGNESLTAYCTKYKQQLCWISQSCFVDLTDNHAQLRLPFGPNVTKQHWWFILLGDLSVYEWKFDDTKTTWLGTMKNWLSFTCGELCSRKDIENEGIPPKWILPCELPWGIVWISS